jgi:hypothetical protein
MLHGLRFTPLIVVCALIGSGTVEAQDRRAALALDAPILSELLREQHAAPFWLYAEQTFQRVEADLMRSVEEGSSAEAVLTQMLRLIAVIGDGHTVLASSDRYTEFGLAPFYAEIYDDGVFIAEVPRGRRQALGAEIVAVGGVPVSDALDRLREVVPHSTESRFRRWARSYLHLPGLAHALGLSDSPDAMTLTLRAGDGRVFTERFERLRPEESTSDRVSLDLPASLRDQKPDAFYYFEPLPGHNAVYFNFRRVTTADSGESVFEFGVRMADYLRTHSVSRLIIDLRENGGGGYQYAAHIRPLLQSIPSLDHPGGIVVLTGPVTYSAASNFLSQIERFTHAVLVGLPPAGRIGEPGDDDDFELPNSGLTVHISQVAGRSESVLDKRSVVEVDVRVADLFADRITGRDAGLEAALAYEPPSANTVVEAAEQWAGRYVLTRDQDLVVRKESGGWRATALPSLDIPLVVTSAMRMQAALPGLLLVLDEDRGGVRLTFADGSERFAPRKAGDSPSAWELVFQGRVDQAEPLLRAAITSAPESPTLSDGAFASEAIHLVFSIQDRVGREEARFAARDLLEAGIALHPEGAPESTFSLRFYPAREPTR